MTHELVNLPPNIVRRLRCAYDYPELVMVASTYADGSVSSHRGLTIFSPTIAINNSAQIMAGLRFLLKGIDATGTPISHMVVRVKRSSSARKSLATMINPTFAHIELNHLMAEANYPEAVYDAFAYVTMPKEQALQIPKIALSGRPAFNTVNIADPRITYERIVAASVIR